jgi:hypothetical protein
MLCSWSSSVPQVAAPSHLLPGLPSSLATLLGLTGV